MVRPAKSRPVDPIASCISEQSRGIANPGRNGAVACIESSPDPKDLFSWPFRLDQLGRNAFDRRRCGTVFVATHRRRSGDPFAGCALDQIAGTPARFVEPPPDVFTEDAEHE